MSLNLRCAAVLIFGSALLARAEQSGQTTGVSQSNTPVVANTAQLIPRSEQERRRQSNYSHEVVLNVLVRDAAGKAVRGLTEGDFTILDQGTAQRITLFRPAQPAHVILLLDAVNGPRLSYAAERKSVEKYLTRSKETLSFPLSIGWLSASGIHVNPESRDPKTLLSQVRAASSAQPWNDSDQGTAQDLGGIAAGRTALPSDLRAQEVDLGSPQNRRFVLSIDALTQFALREENAPGRIVVLWLGTGWPLLTGPEFRRDTAEIKGQFFDRIADLSNDLRDAQISLNVVASPELLRASGLSGDYYEPFLAPVTTANQASAANLALPVLAIHSGGQVLDQNADMASEIADALAGIDSCYSLVFQSGPSSDPDHYRSIRVTVNVPGAVVRTSTGYYAEP